MQRNPEILFWDVDTQVDFIRPSGALHVPGAEEIVPVLARLTEAARRDGVPVLATADDHEPADAEISGDPDFSATYPPHCMHGTPGQEKIPETRITEALVIGHELLSAAEARRRVAAAPDAVVILKKRFDAFSNPNTELVVDAIEPRRIVVYGVALDVCNRAAVEGLWQRGHRDLVVVTDATRALDPEAGEALLADWRRRGVELASAAEVLATLREPVLA
jgi:nicotinamidase/pyrazinamidase